MASNSAILHEAIRRVLLAQRLLPYAPLSQEVIMERQSHMHGAIEANSWQGILLTLLVGSGIVLPLLFLLSLT